MNIIVDTNVILAALIQRGIVRRLLLTSPNTFLTPESCIDEVWKHRQVWNRNNLPEERLRETIDLLSEDFLIVVSKAVYDQELEVATALIDDPDDVPVVALALAVDSLGIWTFNTKDFSKPGLTSRIRILDTSDVKSLLAAA